MSASKQIENSVAFEFGARPLPSGGVQFRVWSPLAKQMAVKINAPREIIVPMERGGRNLRRSRRRHRRRRGLPVRHRWQQRSGRIRFRDFNPMEFMALRASSIPTLSNGPTVDGRARARRLRHRRDPRRHLHAARAPSRAAIEKLDYLRETGITAVEIMPVAQFPGDRNWGYDGVYPYAVQSTYGGPDGLKRLVDAAHRIGLAVIMDVVYNHLGPGGKLSAGLHAVLFASLPKSVGRGAELRRPVQLRHAALRDREFAVLAHRVSHRCAAARRGSQHPRFRREACARRTERRVSCARRRSSGARRF